MTANVKRRAELRSQSFYETHIAYRLTLIHSACKMQTHQLYHLASRTSFSDTITSYRKNSFGLTR